MRHPEEDLARLPESLLNPFGFILGFTGRVHDPHLFGRGQCMEERHIAHVPPSLVVASRLALRVVLTRRYISGFSSRTADTYIKSQDEREIVVRQMCELLPRVGMDQIVSSTSY
jgi:hypothetical protein